MPDMFSVLLCLWSRCLFSKFHFSDILFPCSLNFHLNFLRKFRWNFQIAGIKTLYTGDFSRQEDRHLMAAEIPPTLPDVLVVEATYGVQIHEPRQERERRLTTFVHDVVKVNLFGIFSESSCVFRRNFSLKNDREGENVWYLYFPWEEFKNCFWF